MRKHDFPVKHVRRILEPGPIVLVSSKYKDEVNIMTMGWHTVIEFSPSIVGCVIADSNHSFKLIRKSRECVINVPALPLMDKVVGIGNCSGIDVADKFAKFQLTPEASTKVEAPSIRECFANFECRIYDSRLINKYNFFIFEVLKARVASSPKYPQTMHYHGEGVFTTDGKAIDKSRLFTKWSKTATF
jgi:flavin reductase (DIM6/NTAB) family NADH-FMN oxidoreductase RutF